MDFINNNDSDLNLHILGMLMNDESIIILCDENKDIISLSEQAVNLLDISCGMSIKELFEDRIIELVDTMSRQINPSNIYDFCVIDSVIYLVTISYHRNKHIIVLKRDVDRKKLSTLALNFTNKIQNFLTSNDNIMSKLYRTIEMSDSLREEVLKDRYTATTLQSFCNKLFQFYTNENQNFYGKTCGNLTETISTLVSKIKQEIEICDITIKYDSPIICDFAVEQIESVILNLVSNVFQHCSVSTKIEISISDKNGTIYIHFRDYGSGIIVKDLDTIFNFINISSYKDLPKVKLGLPMVKKILADHSGNVFISSSGEGTFVSMSFPKVVSNAYNDLKNDQTYIKKTAVDCMIKTLAGFEHFKY